MEIISAFIRAIPAAAASPLALVAYLATLAAWAFIAYRVRRFDILMKSIEHVPENDRRAVIEAEFGVGSIPPSLTANEFLVQQRQKLTFYAFLAFCAVVVIIVALTGYTAIDRRDRADNLIEELLGGGVQTQSAPSSQFQSSFNVLKNGPDMLSQAAADLGPPPTKAEIEDAVNQLVQRGLRDAEQINEALAEMFDAGGLQEVSAVLNRAAGHLNEAFAPLADCYRKIECDKGGQIEKMCSSANAIYEQIIQINNIAGKIPGVVLNTTGSPPMFGGGSIDRYFDAVRADNVDYLSQKICAG